VLFNTPIYEQTLQTCWHTGSYKSQVRATVVSWSLEKTAGVQISWTESYTETWRCGLWFVGQIVLLTELLRLQEEKQLPSEMTADDMTELLVEQSKHSLRVKWVTDTHTQTGSTLTLCAMRKRGAVMMELVFSACLKNLGVSAGGLWQRWRQTPSQAGKTSVLSTYNRRLVFPSLICPGW